MGKSVKEIREHIRAVRETRQITNAMYLLSASRMKKIMPHVDYARAYAHRVRAAVKDILTRSPQIEHQYLEGGKNIRAQGAQRKAFLVMASDKGMAGPFNHNVLQFALASVEACADPFLATVGIYASEFFRRRGYQPDREYPGIAQNPSIGNARKLKDELFELYDNGEISEVNVIYMRFVNTMTQYPREVRILPVLLQDLSGVTLEYEYDREMIYHPSPEAVFRELVPQYAIGFLYGALTQSYASENCARMNAMQRATKNADELIDRLVHDYHMARQIGITQELCETVATGLLGR